jgi:Fe-S-cluster containining protein
LANIARFLSLSEEGAFNRFLILDYVVDSEERRYYLCPARRGDRPGRIVTTDWPFFPSPCVFLSNNRCRIEEVKPRGGRELFCRLMTGLNHDLIGYTKKRATRDWNESPLLIQLLSMAIKKESQAEQGSDGLASPSARAGTILI